MSDNDYNYDYREQQRRHNEYLRGMNGRHINRYSLITIASFLLCMAGSVWIALYGAELLARVVERMFAR